MSKPTQAREDALRKTVEDLLWMAARYAHGRHTFAPSIVRDAVRTMQGLFPKWEPRRCQTIQPLERAPSCPGDDLSDLFGWQSNEGTTMSLAVDPEQKRTVWVVTEVTQFLNEDLDDGFTEETTVFGVFVSPEAAQAAIQAIDNQEPEYDPWGEAVTSTSYGVVHEHELREEPS
ncbi:MAG: hypothetical protein AB7S38_28850 [Vulcanimicrobiota bacterium]